MSVDLRRFQLLTIAIGFFVVACLVANSCTAQENGPSIVKMEPPHWWNQGTEREFVLVLMGENLANCHVSAVEEGLKILSSHRRSNPKFLFVRIQVEPDCAPGNKTLTIQNPEGGSREFLFPILDGQTRPEGGHGVESGSTMYLIMPDRFANGDESNDCFDGLLEDDVDREKIDAAKKQNWLQRSASIPPRKSLLKFGNTLQIF